MKILVGIIGAMLVLVGLIFTAQSKSLLGPTSSFMYSNPSWTINGSMFIIAGIIVLILGIIFRISFRHKLKDQK
jgi:heme/copper-type cytochrome/quinol oxidase subunit 2